MDEYAQKMTELYQKYLDEMTIEGKTPLPRWRFEQEIELEIAKKMEVQMNAKRVWWDIYGTSNKGASE